MIRRYGREQALRGPPPGLDRRRGRRSAGEARKPKRFGADVAARGYGGPDRWRRGGPPHQRELPVLLRHLGKR